jgi:AdoMet-dependent heme synthase
MAMTPSGTPLMTPRSCELADAGLSRLAVSLDGSTAGDPRRLPRRRRLVRLDARMIRAARELGLTTQINTTVARHNVDDFENLISLMTDLGISLWSVFFLVPTGRAKPEDIASPEEFERIFHRMYDLSEDGALRHQEHGRAAVPARGPAAAGGGAAPGRGAARRSR